MSNFGQKYVGTVPWLLRVIVSSAVAALIIGAIVGAVMHQSPFWKIDSIVFGVIMVIESIFRVISNQSNKN